MSDAMQLNLILPSARRSDPITSAMGAADVAAAYITIHKLKVVMLRDSRELVVRRTEESLVAFAESLSIKQQSAVEA